MLSAQNTVYQSAISGVPVALPPIDGCAVVGAADDEGVEVRPDGLFASKLNAAVVAWVVGV